MIEFSSEYCDLNEWCCAQMVQQTNWATFLESHSELAFYIHKNDLRGFFAVHQQYFIKKVNQYKGIWEKYKDNWCTIVRKHFSYDYNYKINAYLSLFPIYPRDIEKKAFLVPITDDVNHIVSVVCHELLHFMFYAKCNAICEKEDKELWYVSELIVPLVFDYINECNEFAIKLCCSGYCLTGNMIKEAEDSFIRFINKKIHFGQLVALLRKVIARCL